MDFTDDEIKYMDYLEGIYDCPNYGLLLRKGDPIAFEVGINEWLRNQDHHISLWASYLRGNNHSVSPG